MEEKMKTISKEKRFDKIQQLFIKLEIEGKFLHLNSLLIGKDKDVSPT